MLDNHVPLSRVLPRCQVRKHEGVALILDSGPLLSMK